MASEEAATKLQEELTCSICLECFSDPVSIHCGHSFCRGCITNYWRIVKKKTFSCPRCRETSRKKIVKPNLELKNIVEIAPWLRRKVAKDGGDMTCKRHQEPLKLFCKDDQTLLCVVCDKSKEHQNHVVLPLEEAAQDYQAGRTQLFAAASSTQQGAQCGAGSLLKMPASGCQGAAAPGSLSIGYQGRRAGSFRQLMRQCRLGLSPPSAATCHPRMPIPPVLPGPAYHQTSAATTTGASKLPPGPACRLPVLLSGERRGEVSPRPAHQQSAEQIEIQDQLKCMRQEKEQLLAFKAIGTAKNKETLKKIKSEMQKAESIFQQAHEFLNEQKQFLLAQWESLETAAEKKQEEHAVKLSENISCVDSLITEAEGRCRRPTTEFLQDVKSTLARLKKRKFQEVAEASSELEGSVDSLIKKNNAVEEILQKIKDALPFGVAKEEVSSPAAKRKTIMQMVVPIRNMNAQRSQQVAAYSTSSCDVGLDSRVSSPPPAMPPKQDEAMKYREEKSFPECRLS